MNVIAIDPGECTGIALFQGNTLLQASALPHRHALRYVQGLITGSPYPVKLVGERPQVYASGKSKADPNDLITLALKLGAYFGLADMLDVERVELAPADWKRQLPKHVAALRIKARLTPAECDAVRNLNVLPKTTLHNAIDAIGIGLHFVGRGILAHV